QMDYADLFDIQKNPEGEITAIIANTAKMNVLKSQISLDIQQKIEETQQSEIGIPLGSLFGGEFIAGRGHVIPLKLVMGGIMEIDFKNSFTNAGINQTKHEAYIDIKITVNALMPSGNISTAIATTMPLTHAIIIGKTPNNYANFQL
ncbi:MAG: hypothetical protein GX800_03290, partial [Clostridiaceae bacterium]|nr:hypothetical protein [Clostridiaceae bacterium]